MNNNLDFIEKLVHMVAEMFGKNCEVLYHDWSDGHDHSIKFIENGHVTGRSIYDPANNIILEVIKTGKFTDRINSITRTKDGRYLKSSTIYLTNESGHATGAFCINYDLSDLIQQKNAICELLPVGFSSGSSVNSFYAHDVTDLLDYLIDQAQQIIGKQPENFTKADRLKFVDYLNEKGAFLITKSGEKICNYLGISKFTLYSDLNEIKQVDDKGE